MSTVDRFAADEAWADPDLHRRYVAVLNKSVTLFLKQRGLRRDPRHNRYYFAARTALEERVVTYETLRGRQQSLRVVREERRRDW